MNATCCHVDNYLDSTVGAGAGAGTSVKPLRLDRLIALLSEHTSSFTSPQPRRPLLGCCEECTTTTTTTNGALDNRLMSPRVHLCASCSHVGCFSVLRAHESHSRAHHARLGCEHALSVDLTYGCVYCFECGDYKYDERLEAPIRRIFAAERIFPFGRFTEWQPHASATLVDILAAATAVTTTTTPAATNTSRSFQLRNSSIIGLRGLINLGNTCFMNCVLQALTHTPSLRDYFLSDQHMCGKSRPFTPTQQPQQQQQHSSSGGGRKSNASLTAPVVAAQSPGSVCIVCELVSLFQEFYSGKRQPHIPFNLLYQVWTQIKHLAGYEQQDAHEFFIAALNVIHKNCTENDLSCIELNNMCDIDVTTSTATYNYNSCHCIIDKIFTGGLQSDVCCSACGHVSTKVDPFWDISLDLHMNKMPNERRSAATAAANNAKQQPLRLEDCLHKFTLPECVNSFSCSLCKCAREASKQLTMKNLPVVCCFHLKRFEKSNRVHKKICDHIRFPEILNMTPYMSSSKEENEHATRGTAELDDDEADHANERRHKSNSAGDRDAHKYFLFAVINHHGTLDAGHYTSFIRLRSDQWYKCDDHIISKASLADVMNSEGYLLFYHKIWHNYSA